MDAIKKFQGGITTGDTQSGTESVPAKVKPDFSAKAGSKPKASSDGMYKGKSKKK